MSYNAILPKDECNEILYQEDLYLGRLLEKYAGL